MPCSAPLPPWLHGVPNETAPSCFLTPKNGFPTAPDGNPLTQTLSSSSPYYFLPVLLHHCGVFPSSQVGSVYSLGMGWLTGRQFHLTVSGSFLSFLGGFSTLVDKLLLMVLNACYKSPCPARPTNFDLPGRASLSPELHLHEPETGSLNQSGLKISQIFFNEVSTTILRLRSDRNTS